jgi:hypothetical protein
LPADYKCGVMRALLRRLPNGTYRVERVDADGRRAIEDYSTLIAALSGDGSLRDVWRPKTALGTAAATLDPSVLYLVPE